MEPKSFLITLFPLTSSHVDRLRDELGIEFDAIAVSSMTADTLGDIIRRFRSLRGKAVYLPIVDEETRGILPILKLLSLFARVKTRAIIEPDMSIRNFGLLAGIVDSFRLIFGLAMGVIALVRQSLLLARILGTERARVGTYIDDKIIYLKTNLWAGIWAGGSVAHTAGVIGALVKRGLHVDYLSSRAPIGLPQSDKMSNRLIASPKAYILPRELNNLRHDITFTRFTREKLASSPAVIYQRLSLANFSGVRLSHEFKLPLIIEYNGSEVWLAENWGRRLALSRLARSTELACLRHAHLIVTVSEVLKDQLVKQGISPDRIVAYPNGVDPSAFDPAKFSAAETASLRESYGIPPDAVVATFVGTLGHWHGAEILAETLRRMAAADRDWLLENKFHVIFVGEGVQRRNVEEILSAPDLAPFFTMTGLVERARTPLIMAASDIMVAPHKRNPDGSPFFGSPTKLFEYMASAKPVIGSALDQIADVLDGSPRVAELGEAGSPPQPHQCGILTTPEDTGELRAALRFLVENPEWREAAGVNARMRVLERYTWDHHVDAVIEGLERVLAAETVAPKIRKTRVLINGLHSKSGGGVTYIRNVLPILAGDPELDVHLCVHQDQLDLVPPDLENLTPHVFNFKSGFWRLAFWEQIALPRLARRIGADVMFSPANYGPIFARNTVIMLRNALSVAFVERRPVKLAYWALVSVGTALSLVSCRRAIAVSDFAKISVGKSLFGLANRRVEVVHHGVSDIFTPPPAGQRRGDYLLAVADIYVQKNLANLLLAVAKMRGEHPDIRLKIAGRIIDDDHYGDLMKIVRREKLDDTVEFLSEVSERDLVDLYHGCRIFVFPSTVETFGNPLVEAMASGAPIASSDTAAMPEVVGDAALFFDPSDIADMADKLDTLMRDPRLREELSRRAVERSRDFSWSETAAKTSAIFKRAARKKAA